MAAAWWCIGPEWKQHEWHELAPTCNARVGCLPGGGGAVVHAGQAVVLKLLYQVAWAAVDD
jgi:hypothetical protein